MHNTMLKNIALTVVLSRLVSVSQTVEISGILLDSHGNPRGGVIDVIEESSDLSITTYQVDSNGEFWLTVSTVYNNVVHASAEGYPPDERLIRAGSSGDIGMKFIFPFGQHLSGRVVDSSGYGVSNAVLNVRYHELDRPMRRSAFHPFHMTNKQGYFLLMDVGINTPFFVDVHADGYLPKSIGVIMKIRGETRLNNITLIDKGGSVIVDLTDGSGSPVESAEIVLLADPSGYDVHEIGSLLHNRAFHQRKRTSRHGDARFSGVPPGRIRLHALSTKGSSQVEAKLEQGQTLRLSLQIY